LGQQAHDVDAVTDEIRNIAEQVSLLALNAKIEAARAGEAGKGFAVVAQEITELALDSNQATLKADEIAQSVVGVEEVSADVARESRQLSASANELSKMAQEFSDMMKQFKV
jgi:methyl-accepting chemotaxis protein